MKTGDKYFIYCDISRWETHYSIATLSVSNNNCWIPLVLLLIEMQVTIYLYFCCKLICKTGWVGELKSLEVKLLIFQQKRIHFHSPDTPWSADSFRGFHSSLYLLSMKQLFWRENCFSTVGFMGRIFFCVPVHVMFDNYCYIFTLARRLLPSFGLLHKQHRIILTITSNHLLNK